MPRLSLLSLLLILSVQSSLTCQQNIQEKKHIMFLSPPAHSHVALLREIAIALKENYPQYRVTFGSGGKYLSMTEDVGIETFDTYSREERCLTLFGNPKLMMNMLDYEPGDPDGFAANLGHFGLLYDCTFDYAEKVINETKPDLIILDFMVQSGKDLAYKYNIDYAMLASLGTFGWEQGLYLPDMRGRSLDEMHSIWGRLSGLAHLAKVIKMMLLHGNTIGNSSRARGFPQSMPTTMLENRLVIVPEPFGFVPARRLPPLVKVVGFLAPPADSPRAITHSKSDFKDLFNFIDSIPENATLIYVAFGSTAYIHQHTFELLINTLLSNPSIHLLVGIRAEVPLHLDFVPEQLRSRIRKEQWTPQSRVLAHKNVKIFLSHGGLSSVSEAVQGEVPMIVMPLFADQGRNAFLLKDAGMATVLRQLNMTREAVLDALNPILANYSSYKGAAARLRRISEVAGGAQAAARAIHEYVLLGKDHLYPVEDKFSFVEKNQLDIIGIAVVVLIVVFVGLFKLLRSTKRCICG